MAKSHPISENEKSDRLQLLRDVSGSFRPGVLTALVGVSGGGKTTLMDVLAGRNTGGYIEGSMTISGYPKKQDTFARFQDIVSKQAFIRQMSQSMNLLYIQHGYAYQGKLITILGWWS
ncbi:hypothetical protein O6H91_09G096700 [Diphasiastrum complanatum]|uniref:Uncharacterized protein n=1 Tax=Diphasiastrum complanatum TaxID=34168 RepID=A0ACC2CS11_DIPCM|nr:hypothetical protein O6H91_09G096700 [Diphasiastrum complanatum]